MEPTRSGPAQQGPGGKTAQQKLDELNLILRTLDELQEAFAAFVSANELRDAEGRRADLVVTGVGDKPVVYQFVVSGGRVRITADGTSGSQLNTRIVAPIDSVVRVLQGVLNGNEKAFFEEMRRNQVRLEGAKNFHDATVFGETFGRLARLIRNYRSVLVKQ